MIISISLVIIRGMKVQVEREKMQDNLKEMSLEFLFKPDPLRKPRLSPPDL